MFFSERFLAPRPLLEAISSEQPVVLLIDEVDRADEALEAVLLELLSEWQISIPEIGTVKAKVLPYVVLTSNNTRDLSAALKRRCLHMFLDYPTAERELDIVRSKDTGLPEALAVRLVEIVRGLRDLELRKAPSISETIDWARTLAVLGVAELTGEVLGRDPQRGGEVRARPAPGPGRPPAPGRPQRDRPRAPRRHGHGHGHGHGAGAEPRHDDGDLDGVAKRAAKDEPGRHDKDYYGSPGGRSGGSRTVSAEKGERSFAAGARKRPV